jgi:nucleotide-binding universal stress UspA family protein
MGRRGHDGFSWLLIGTLMGPVGILLALDAALRILGSSVGRVTLLTVVPFDGGIDADREALAAIREEAERHPELRPDLEVRRGHPAAVIAELAARDHYDLVVIGTRGAGRHLFGSAARELATASPVPVLLLTGTSRSVAHTPAV